MRFPKNEEERSRWWGAKPRWVVWCRAIAPRRCHPQRAGRQWS